MTNVTVKGQPDPYACNTDGKFMTDEKLTCPCEIGEIEGCVQDKGCPEMKDGTQKRLKECENNLKGQWTPCGKIPRPCEDVPWLLSEIRRLQDEVKRLDETRSTITKDEFNRTMVETRAKAFECAIDIAKSFEGSWPIVVKLQQAKERV